LILARRSWKRKRRVFEERKKTTMKAREVRMVGGWIRKDDWEEREEDDKKKEVSLEKANYAL